MLLTLFAIVVGSLIGWARGGRWSGVVGTELRSPRLLTLALATIFVQIILNPIFPFLWAFVSLVALVVFARRNRQLTGMTIVMIGMILNLFVLVINGATPVSESALLSVGDLNVFGMPNVDGARVASEGTRFSFLGDVFPVPFFNSVVSLGDLIALVGLADIFTNLFLSARDRELSFDDAGVSFRDAQTPSAPAKSRVSFLSPLQTGSRSKDESAHRLQRRKAAPASHVPAHAAPPDGNSDHQPDDQYEAQPPPPGPQTGHAPAHAAEPEEAVDITDDELVDQEPVHSREAETLAADNTLELERPDTMSVETVDTPGTIDLIESIDLDESESPLVVSLDENGDPVAAAGMHALQPPPPATPEEEPQPEVIDLTSPDDPRPIIDLTQSPTDSQMAEFLRRRKVADREHEEILNRPPGQRRGRAPVRIRSDRNNGVVESNQ